eukprot:1161878-Pelagomonas_calceolata.AAC.12
MHSPQCGDAAEGAASTAAPMSMRSPQCGDAAKGAASTAAPNPSSPGAADPHLVVVDHDNPAAAAAAAAGRSPAAGHAARHLSVESGWPLHQSPQSPARTHTSRLAGKLPIAPSCTNAVAAAAAGVSMTCAARRQRGIQAADTLQRPSHGLWAFGGEVGQ